MASTIPQRASRPPLTSAPPTGPLPALPVSKHSRKPLPDIPDQNESRPTTSSSNVSSATTNANRKHARSITSSGLPTPKPSKTSSSPAVPTLNTTNSNNDATATTNSPSSATSTTPSSAIPTPGKTLRKTTSIGQFPLPPQVAKQTRVSSLPPSPLSNATSTTDANGAAEDRTKRDSSSAKHRSSESGAQRKSKTRSSGYGLRARASNASLYGSASTPSLLNGTGESNVVASATEGVRVSDTSMSSRGQSHSTRSSSVNGSYHTDLTSFDDDEMHDSMSRGRRKSQETLTDKRRSSAHTGKDTKGNVIVSVRVRPDAGGGNSNSGAGKDTQTDGEWMVDGRRSLISYRGREGGEYRYDNVFSPHDQNARVYDHAAKRLVRRVMEGYHGTVFAYGMTGTGKTFSMQGTSNSPGVIPLAISDIFSYIREKPSREFLLRVSYLEIYNEKIYDLLVQSGIPGQDIPAGEIKLREDSKRGVYATPLKEEIVQSPNQLLRVIARGDLARRTAGTQFNARSSRSHAVVQIVVESRERTQTAPSDKSAPLPGGVLVSTLSLIDLAGSEKAADNKERRTEGAHINKSLLTLGTVIARLSGDEERESKEEGGATTSKAETAGKPKHLPYRDSKLTRLLQPALSGNSLVSILCTIQLSAAGTSAASTGLHTGETLGTLKFASRAKNNIVSHAKRNESNPHGGDAGSRALLDHYRIEIQELRAKLEEQSKAHAENEEKDELEKDMQMEKDLEEEERVRREEQMTEMSLAHTALQHRISELNKLILSSKSRGVNSKFGRPSSTSTQVLNRLSAASDVNYGRPVSVRSRDSQYSRASSTRRESTATLDARRPSLARSISTGSTTPGGKRSSSATPSPNIGGDEDRSRSRTSVGGVLPQTDDDAEEDEEDENDALATVLSANANGHTDSTGLASHQPPPAEGEASLAQQNRMLQADLADKNRYIATLEKRLLQARRTSHSRVSMQFAPRGSSVHAQQNDDASGAGGTGGASASSTTAAVAAAAVAGGAAGVERVLSEKDREIDDLRAKLDDQTRMVNALRSAARKPHMMDPPPPSAAASATAAAGVGARGRRSLAGESSYVSSSADDTVRGSRASTASTIGAGGGAGGAASVRTSRSSLRNSQQSRFTNGTANANASAPSPPMASTTTTAGGRRSLSNASRSSVTAGKNDTTYSSGMTSPTATAAAVAAAANRPPYNRLPPTPLSPISTLSPSAEEDDRDGFDSFHDVPPGSAVVDSSNPTSPVRSTANGGPPPVAGSGKRISHSHRRRSVDEVAQLIDQMIQHQVESSSASGGGQYNHQQTGGRSSVLAGGRRSGATSPLGRGYSSGNLPSISAAAAIASTSATSNSAEGRYRPGSESGVGLGISNKRDLQLLSGSMGGAGEAGSSSAQFVGGPLGAPPSSPPPPLPVHAAPALLGAKVASSSSGATSPNIGNGNGSGTGGSAGGGGGAAATAAMMRRESESRLGFVSSSSPSIGAVGNRFSGGANGDAGDNATGITTTDVGVAVGSATTETAAGEGKQAQEV